MLDVATFGTGMLTAPVGFPVMVHGLDQFFTGMSTAITGKPRDSVTSQTLQKIGMSRKRANFADNVASIGGTMGGAAIIRASRWGVVQSFDLSKNRPWHTQTNRGYSCHYFDHQPGSLRSATYD